MTDIANMLRFHREGMLRVGTIIDGNPSYDALMGEKLTDGELTLFDGTVGISAQRRHAIQVAEGKVRMLPVNIIRPAFSGFACEGNSSNNLREFAFFERTCPDVRPLLSRSNYSNCNRYSHSSLSTDHQDALESIVDDIRAFYQSRHIITASLVRQQVLYSRSFFGFLISFSDAKAIKPTALVQANDHSPVRVALSMIMKALQVPRIYLQHAEVTRHFPPLDFEHSVLRNAHSLAIYREIGPIAGKTYVLPRHEGAFARERLAAPRDKDITVTIYPTSRILADGLQKILDVLRSNPAVERILIKQHPGARRSLNEQLDTAGVILVDDIPAEDHIALVGNSSVAVELLHRGIPVYQNFSFDPVERDYYGFVQSGLTFEVDQKSLSGPFWRPYQLSEKWLDEYARWNPSADSGSVEQHARFVDEIGRLAELVQETERSHTRQFQVPGRLFDAYRSRIKRLMKPALVKVINANQRPLSRFIEFALANTNLKVGNASGKAASIMFIERTLSDLRRPAEWLLLSEKVRAFTPVEMISALEEMFQKRNPALKTVFEGFPRWPSGAVVGTWAYLKKLELGNVALHADEFAAISKFIYTLNAGKDQKRHLERLLLSAILRYGTVDQLDQFWASASVFRKQDLPISKQIEVLRKLRSVPARALEAQQTRADFEKRASRFDLLKFRNMDALDRQGAEDWNHAHAEQQFALVAPRGVAREYTASVRPIYDALRPRMQFMDTRTNASEADAFLSLVKAAIQDRKPFSLVRLSDGEGYLFPEGRFFGSADAADRERHWWGTELPGDLRSAIIAEARDAIAQADIVGIPAVYRFIRDHTDWSRSLTQSIQGRGLLQVLNGAPNLIAVSARIAEDKVNVSSLSDLQTIASLARLAGKVIIVGSVKRENLPPPFDSGPNVELIPIPTHNRTSLNDKYHSGSKPLPFVYPALLEKLRAAADPGDLVLVAGGIIGKIFVGCARSNGAVALDIGSILDDWVQAGAPTMR
ncbi:hypothetical protein [Nitratireductor soli]|uniref:hypothetical protein n=1 Tax=Nitratireductor soli TaxID=1670619 RepID=UPI00065DE42E|nr:hypothetical protein [Nitratireductor soli]